jgi:DNA polymerase III epsilon subunit-like protein
MSKQTFCVLDLEGTGLDPKKDAITEVGAALFEIGKNGEVKFGKTFSSLVKPEIPIPPFIQELTNIREADVKDAPVWETVRPQFKKFVGKHTIVGQNVNFDLSFLAARGLEFSQSFIDTKELAQIFLPEVGRYNLEYLLRYFGVEQKTQHRALADAQATAELLGQIIASFHKLPEKVQKAAAKLLSGSNLPYEKLFSPGKSGTLAASAPGRQETLFDSEKSSAKTALPKSPSELIKNFSGLAEGQYLADLAVEDFSEKNLAGVLSGWPGKGRTVFSAPSQSAFAQNSEHAQSMGWKILDEPANYFCRERFELLFHLPRPAAGLRQFLIKLLIWRHHRPQGKLSDLMLVGEEFFYRQLVCAEAEICSKHKNNSDGECELAQAQAELRAGGKIFTHHSAWLSAAAGVPADLAHGIFWDAEALEKTIQRANTRTYSLPGIRWGVKNLFDPSDNSGVLGEISATQKKLFERTLNTLDLSFGLMSLALSEEQTFPQRVMDNEFRESEQFEKIKNAGQGFVAELDELLSVVEKIRLAPESEQVKVWLIKYLTQASSFIKEFFAPATPGTAAWFDFFNGRLKLKSLTLRPAAFAPEKFQSLIIAGLFGTAAVKAYFRRVFKLQDAADLDAGEKAKPALEMYLPENRGNARVGGSAKLLAGILRESAGRTLVLFNSQKALEESYETFLSEPFKPRLFAQRVTGHHWKNLESYSARDDAIWFIPSRQFLEKLDDLPPTAQLVVVRIPYETPGVQESFYDPDEVFPEFILPKTAANLGEMVGRFTNSGETGGDKKIIFLDPRISLDYNEPLLDFLSSKYELRISEYSAEDDPELFGAKGNKR